MVVKTKEEYFTISLEKMFLGFVLLCFLLCSTIQVLRKKPVMFLSENKNKEIEVII